MNLSAALGKIIATTWVMCLATVGVCAPRAVANISPQTRLYAEARVAFSKGDLGMCKKNLESSLLPKPNVNGVVLEESRKLLGICYFLSGNKSGAQKLFQQVVTANPKATLRKEDIVDPTLAQFFEKMKNRKSSTTTGTTLGAKPLLKARAAERTGIVVHTNAERATVFDDGIFIGPANQFIEIDPGTHNLTISAEGFVDSKYNLKLNKSQAMDLKITLKKPPKPAPKVAQKNATQKKLSSAKNNGSKSTVDYGATLPVPKQGASLAEEFKPPPTPAPIPQQQIAATPPRTAQALPTARPKTTAELLAPPTPPAAYAPPSPYVSSPQYQSLVYPQPQAYAPQPIYAPQPMIIQQQPILVQPQVAYQQPYYQPNYQPTYQHPAYTPPQYSPPATTITRDSRPRSSTNNSVRQKQNINPALAFLPLGIGQFQKGEIVKGIVFAGAQIGGIGWGVWSYTKEANFVKLEADALANDDPNAPETMDDNFNPDQAKAYKKSQQLNQYIGYGVAGAAWIISIIDGVTDSTPRKKRAEINRISESEADSRYALTPQSKEFHWNLFSSGGNIGINFRVDF